MNERQQIIWDTSQAVLESQLRIIELTGKELIVRGRNPLVINEIVYQEKMRVLETNMVTRLEKLRQAGE